MICSGKLQMKKNEVICYNTISQLLLNSPFGIAIFSAPDLFLIDANQVWLKRLEEPYDNIACSAGKPISEIITGWKGSPFERLWETALQTKEGVRLHECSFFRMKRSNISYWDISITPIFKGEEVAFFIETVVEVTEDELSRNNNSYRSNNLCKNIQNIETIFEYMSDGFFVVYPDYSIVALNSEAHIIKHYFNSFKYNDIPANIKYYTSTNDEIPYNDLPVFKIIQGDTFNAYIVTVVTNEDTHHFSVSGRPIYDSTSNIYISFIRIVDVTKQVNADYDLKIEKQKMEYLEKRIEEKDNFLSLISHEFKTPLTVIMAAIQALERCSYELSDKANWYINTIRHNTLRQFRLVRNLLDITSRITDKSELSGRNVDIVLLTKFISEEARLYSMRKELNIYFVCDIEEKIIFIDDEKYKRVLLNLLSNAIKFTPKGKNVYIELFFRNGFLNLIVKDEGVGIPEDKIGVIFERFGQVDKSLSRLAEGSGIGLFLSKLFVEELGGTISVTSKIDEGTTFKVIIPTTPNVNGMCDIKYENENRKILEMLDIEFSDIYFSR